MKRFALLFLICLLTTVSAQDSTETHRKILVAVTARDYQTAISELQKLQAGDNRSFEINNYDYLLARLAERTGDFAAAMANFQAVVNRNSVLKEYALWHLAEISRSSGNMMLERIYLRELLTIAPDSLINTAADSRIARSELNSQDFDAAIGMLLSSGQPNESVGDTAVSADEVLGNLNGNDASTRENLVLLGHAYWLFGNTVKARTVFTKLVDAAPNPEEPDDFALEGVRGLDKLEVGHENFGKTAPQLSESEQFNRASIYQFNRDFEIARIHYQSLISRFPKNPDVPMAMYQIGRGFQREGNFSKAADWFERVQGEFPDSPVSQDSLYQAASAYARVNKTKEAVSRFEKYIGKYPEAANLERAYLNIVDIMRDKGETIGALNWTAKTREKFRDKLPEAIAIFAQARIHISQQDWNKALVDLESLRFLGNLGDSNTPGGTSNHEILFLKAYVLEQLGQNEGAIDVYLSIPDGRHQYYGWRANERLQLLLKNEHSADLIQAKFYPLRIKSSQKITALSAEEIRIAAQSAIRLTDVTQTKEQLLETIRKTYSFLPEYRRIPEALSAEFRRREVLDKGPPPTDNHHQDLAQELLFLGLYDEGTPEFVLGTKEAGNEFKYNLAIQSMRGDLANRSIAYIEPLWRKVPADFQIELIPGFDAQMLYPAPYRDAMVKFASQKGVDPRFLLAMMRQESRFRPDVKSASAARGLLQFISSTSGRIANKLGKQNFQQNDLYHPPTAILFGSQYLSDLFGQFPNQPQAVAASYNGGEDNMQRWYARANSNDPDRYVAEILFAQSKDYVYKVMENYRVYQMIYDEDLNPKDHSSEETGD